MRSRVVQLSYKVAVEMRKDKSISMVESDMNASLEFCLRLSRAYSRLTRQIDNSLSSLHGLSFIDFTILYYLGRAPATRLRRIDLAERLGLTASGVTRSLLPLEKIGLVERQADPRDARVGYASITDAGRRLLENALLSIRLITQDAIESVSPDQLRELSLTLGQLAGINLSNS